MKQNIDEAFDCLYAQVIIIYYGIPKKLLKDDNHVDLGKFTKRVKGRTAYQDPKTGWEIDKHTNPKGR